MGRECCNSEEKSLGRNGGKGDIEVKHLQRLELAKKALLGTSIGDAFGESFFGETNLIHTHLSLKTVPDTSWEFTDDTVMTIAIFEQLEENKSINQDELALLFSRNHNLDENRGYGATARRILREVSEGNNWKSVAQAVFEGMGSMGNGASMRVSPIGAYFYDDLEKVKIEARKSAEVTHTNIEGITGAIAVALASALATQIQIQNTHFTPQEFIQTIVEHLPQSDTTSKIKKSLSIPEKYHIDTLKSILGNGTKIMAQDTVPFCIWCVAYHLDSFEESIWKAISILGDRDTICAIVGGITILSSKEDTIPKNWIDNVENWERSIFRNNQS